MADSGSHASPKECTAVCGDAGELEARSAQMTSRCVSEGTQAETVQGGSASIAAAGAQDTIPAEHRG